ncbi:MAG TPA: hypothetical protein VH054_20070 [Polyangiaceae bacterium]|nr:hypothetical protein [Polyangiaceae bacterium]
MTRKLLLLAMLASCKDSPATDAAPAASASVVASASASASASATMTSGPPTYAGTYDAERGTLYVPDAEAWHGVGLRPDDAGATGEGAITLVIDPDGGAVTGSLDGPLGPATLSGVSQEGALSFQVAPKEKTDLAFRGTGTASLDAGVVSGEMHLSSWRANVLRDATFSAKRK